MRNTLRSWLAVSGACLALAAPSLAQAGGSSVLETAINIPDGPASIEGFGQGYDVSPSSGLPSLSYPISVPPGRVGLQPSVSLSYEGGGGSGLLGMGWSMGQPALEVSMQRGIPRYDGSDNLALRGLGASEELVRMPGGEYREQIEGASPVIVRAMGEGFEAVTTSGMRYVFGTSAESRFDGPQGTYKWHLEAMIDTSGNRVEYSYTRLSGTSRPLLSRIEWNDGAAAVNFDYEARPDEIRSHSCGFPATTNHRLASIHTEAEGELVQTWTLGYTTSPDTPSSMLVSIASEAADGERLPTWQLQYAAMMSGDPQPQTVLQGPGVDPTADGFAWVDVDGDAVPDLLRGNPGNWEWRRNVVGTRLEDWQPLTQSPSVALTASSLWADIDGNGVGDLVHQTAVGGDAFTYLGGGAEPFGTSTSSTPSFSFDLSDPRTRMVDVNADSRVDVVHSNDANTFVLTRQYDQEGYLATLTLPAFADGMRLDDPGVSMSDVQGDGIPDLVRVDKNQSKVFIAEGVGYGTFATAYEMQGVPNMNPVDRWELRDMNGDGSADLVRVGQGGLDIYINQLNGRFMMAKGLTWPDLQPEERVIFSDVNGNGTLDVLRVDTTGAMGWRFWDLLGRKPGLLDHFENGLGYTIDFTYSSAAQMAADLELGNKAWTQFAPNAMPLVVQTVQRDGWDWEQVKTHEFRDPYYDPFRREFRGFAETIDVREGDEYSETATTRTVYDLGRAEEARKLKSLVSELSGETGVISRTLTTYQVFDRTADTEVALPIAVDTYHIEQGPEDQAKRTRTETEYDDWGNVTVTREFGLVDLNSGADVPGDERVTTMSYASGGDIRDRVAEELVEDGAGEQITRRRTYYDGPEGGLPLGEVGLRGLPSRVSTWVADDEWVDDAIFLHDVYGNVRLGKGPEGQEIARSFDELGRFAVEERVALSPEAPVTELVTTATWDPRFGTVSSKTGPNGAVMYVEYDGLGRPVSTAYPGDDLSTPSLEYTYRLDGSSFPPSISTLARVQGTPNGDDERATKILDGIGRSRVDVTQDDAGTGAIMASFVHYSASGSTALLHTGQPVGVDWLEANGLPEVDATWPATTTLTDASDRVLRSTREDGRTNESRYGPLTVLQFDAGDLGGGDYAQAPDLYEKDGLDHMLRTRHMGPAGEVVWSYQHDAIGRPISFIDPEGYETSYRFDGRSLLVEVQSADHGVLRREYDRAGRLLRSTDARGATVAYTYDPTGRETRIVATLPNGEVDSDKRFVYDVPPEDAEGEAREYAIGMLTRVEDDAGTLEMTHDLRGRMVRESRVFHGHDGPMTLSASYEWDNLDRPIKETFPDGRTLSRSYGHRGLEISLGNLIPEIRYDALGRVERVEYGNGAARVRTYDRLSRVLSESVSGISNGEFALQYEYDTVGLLKHVDDLIGRTELVPTRTQTFVHDDLHRLVRAAGDYGVREWSFESDDFMISHAGVELMRDAAHPHAVGTADGQVHRYDAAGNLVAAEGEGPTAEGTWTYDAHGRVFRVTSATGEVVENIYDFNGDRAIRRTFDADGKLTDEVIYFGNSEVRNGHLVRFAATEGEKLAETTSENEVPRGGYDAHAFFALVFGGLCIRRRSSEKRENDKPRAAWWRVSTRLAQGLTLFALFVAACKGSSSVTPAEGELVVDEYARFYVNDRLGSNALVLDHEAKIVSNVGTLPYGADWFEASSEGAVGRPAPYSFTGKERDPVGGSIYFGARHYLPSIAQWTSPDPMVVTDSAFGLDRPREMNPFSYVLRNPIDLIDLLGFECESNQDCMAQAFGGIIHERKMDTAGFEARREQLVQNWVRESFDFEDAYVEVVMTMLDPGLSMAGRKLAMRKIQKMAAEKLAREGAEKAAKEAAEEAAERTAKRAAGKAAKRKPPCPISNSPCFAAGTPIATPEGARAIEDLVVGDVVFARDPEAGVAGERAVLRTFETRDVALWVVAHSPASASSTEADEIITTAEHPFWVPDVGWVQVSNLSAGDTIIDLEGRRRTVTGATPTGNTGLVYNFEVEGLHTYFAGAPGLLVHNCPSGKAGAGSGARAADRVEGGLKKGRPLTDKQAIERLRSGKDVYTPSAKAAKGLQKKASHGKPVKDAAHGDGYFDHVHGKDRAGGHAFHGEPK